MYHQLTIWHELVDANPDIPERFKDLAAGMCSRLCVLPDDRLVAAGRIARRESSAAARRHRPNTVLVWDALLDSARAEWARRHAVVGVRVEA